MIATAARCFHDRTGCGFCKVTTAPKPKRRCACCGRFIARADVDDTCPRCVVRGFRALRLFDIGDVTAVA